MNERLTPREIDLLHYIIHFKQINGFSPSVKQMCAGINTKSSNHINIMLDDLTDKHYIERIPNQPRSITIIKFPN